MKSISPKEFSRIIFFIQSAENFSCTEIVGEMGQYFVDRNGLKVVAAEYRNIISIGNYSCQCFVDEYVYTAFLERTRYHL